QQRGAIEKGIGDAAYEVAGAGAQGREAHPGKVGEPAGSLGHHRGLTFVVREDHVHSGRAQTLHQGQDFTSRQAKGTLDPGCFEVPRDERGGLHEASIGPVILGWCSEAEGRPGVSAARSSSLTSRTPSKWMASSRRLCRTASTTWRSPTGTSSWPVSPAR